MSENDDHVEHQEEIGEEHDENEILYGGASVSGDQYSRLIFLSVFVIGIIFSLAFMIF
jgi:hypothetical protein